MTCSMLISTDGIVLKTKPLGNDDHVYTILTREKGVITAFARSRQKISRGMGSALELFTYSNFVLFQSKDRYSINSASSNKVFFGIRSDIEKVSLASYLSELLIELAPEEGEDPNDYLRLFLNCLAMLENNKRSVQFIKPLFGLRLMALAGYMPDLIGCVSCGESEGKSLCFIPSEGSLICGNCIEQVTGQQMIQITPGELAAMRHIIYAPVEKLFSFALPDSALKRLSAITESYIYTQLDKTFHTLEFYHTLIP